MLSITPGPNKNAPDYCLNVLQVVTNRSSRERKDHISCGYPKPFPHLLRGKYGR